MTVCVLLRSLFLSGSNGTRVYLWQHGRSECTAAYLPTVEAVRGPLAPAAAAAVAASPPLSPSSSGGGGGFLSRALHPQQHAGAGSAKQQQACSSASAYWHGRSEPPVPHVANWGGAQKVVYSRDGSRFAAIGEAHQR